MLYPTIGVPLPGKSIFHRCLLTWYTRCLNRAGANVQILNLYPYEAAIAQALAQCDGFYFPAGRISSRSGTGRRERADAGRQIQSEMTLNCSFLKKHFQHKNRCFASGGECSF